MKLTVPPDSLKACWKRVSGIPRSKSPSDLNQLVRISAKDQTMTLAAQNHLVTGVSKCRADVDTPHDGIFVPAARFANIPANATNMVGLSKGKQNELLVESTGWKLKMPSASHASQMPALSDSATSFVTSVETLLRGLSAARQACGDSHKSFAVEMVVLDFGADPHIYGADGVHFSSVPLKAVEEREPSGHVLVPSEGGAYIVSFFSGEEGLVRIKYDSNVMVIWNNDCALYVRLGEGKVFNFARVMEMNKPSVMVEVATSSFSETVKKVMATVDSESPDHAGVDVAVKDGELTLSSVSQYGESTAQCSVQSEEPVEFACRLGAARLQKAVQQCSGPLTRFGISDSKQAVSFACEDLTWMLAVIGEAD